MCPLLYAIVGFPEPASWFTPFEIEKAYVNLHEACSLAYEISFNRTFFWLVLKIFFPRALPFDTRTFAGFTTAVIFNVIIATSLAQFCAAFGALYAGICSFIKPCIDDVSMVIDHINANVDEKLSFRDEMIQIIQLHSNCYRHVKSFYLLNIAVCWWIYALLHSILSKLERIIRAPVFFQISIFGLQTAILLFQTEIVSNKGSMCTEGGAN